jgi:DNA-binding XRE family transcriptional regulator
MKSSTYVEEHELAALAKKYRRAAGKTKVEVAREMGIKPPSIYHAEESPEQSFTKLRCRIIESYSNLKVSGPFFRIDEK